MGGTPPQRLTMGAVQKNQTSSCLRLLEAWDGMHARVASPASSLARPLETVSKNRPRHAQVVLICPYSQGL